MSRPYPHTLLSLVLLLLAGCGAPPSKDESMGVEPTVAVVAGEPIYAKDFVLNYELGFPHLRRGEYPRLAYLQRVIDEKLLALEGRRLGLDRSPDVQRQMDDLREELLVEQVFERHVNAEIEVTDDEVREAGQKDRVSFKIRYLPFSTLDRARDARSAAEVNGFEQIVLDFAAAQTDVPIRPEDLESPYLTWRDIHPQLLAAIEHLVIGELSQPVPYQGSFLLVEILDVRREPVEPIPSADDRTRYEQVVFQRKARARAREFIGSIMKPLDVRVKPQPYLTLRNSLWRWHQEAAPQKNLLRALENADGAYADSIRSILGAVLITTRDGDWTVGRFLREYPLQRYPLRHQRTDDFESDLYDAIGLTLRDSVFVARAEQEGLDAHPVVRGGLRLWSDKWLFRAMVDRIEHEGRSIDSTLAVLRDRYPTEIEHAVLDSLELSNPQSPGMSLLKAHTMRAAFPVADAAW